MTDPKYTLRQKMGIASGRLLDETFGQATDAQCWAAEIRVIADEIPKGFYGAGGVRRWLLDEAKKAEIADDRTKTPPEGNVS
jgi:hypothetical protein